MRNHQLEYLSLPGRSSSSSVYIHICQTAVTAYCEVSVSTRSKLERKQQEYCKNILLQDHYRVITRPFESFPVEVLQEYPSPAIGSGYACVNIAWSQTVLSIPSSSLQRFNNTVLETAQVMVRMSGPKLCKKVPMETEVIPSHSLQDYLKISKKCQLQP